MKSYMWDYIRINLNKSRFFEKSMISFAIFSMKWCKIFKDSLITAMLFQLKSIFFKISEKICPWTNCNVSYRNVSYRLTWKFLERLKELELELHSEMCVDVLCIQNRSHYCFNVFCMRRLLKLIAYWNYACPKCVTWVTDICPKISHSSPKNLLSCSCFQGGWKDTLHIISKFITTLSMFWK